MSLMTLDSRHLKEKQEPEKRALAPRTVADVLDEPKSRRGQGVPNAIRGWGREHVSTIDFDPSLTGQARFVGSRQQRAADAPSSV
jgi:hypothetical protein